MKARPAALCIAPHFAYSVPPAGAPALLAYLRSRGCDDFGLADFRTWLPVRERTWSDTGLFGETFVVDVPELPLVLGVLRRFRERAPSLVPEPDALFVEYCLLRGLAPEAVHRYLRGVEGYFASGWRAFREVRFFGFTTWASNYLVTLLAAATLKRERPEAFVVAGGAQVSESRSAARLGLRGGVFDAVVVGEGERALADLYADFLAGRAGRPLPGILFSEDAEPGGPRPGERRLLDLGELPAPCFDGVDLSGYAGWRRHRMLPFQLSRGCTEKCSFCSEWVFWERFRPAPVERSLDQVQELRRLHGVEHLSLTDSTINAHPGRAAAFAEGLVQRAVPVSWSGFMRAQVDRQQARLYRRSGCRSVFVGVESLSDEALVAMRKRRTAAENVEAVEILAEEGIAVEVGLIAGFPGDSRESFQATVRRLSEIQRRHPGRVRVNLEAFRPSPGQPIFAELERRGLQPSPWSEEVRDIDPFFADITGDVWCSVSGDHQGPDRGGEVRYARLRTREASSRVAMGPHWGPLELTPLRPGESSLAHLRGGWFRLCWMDPRGELRFLIVDQDEVDALGGAGRLSGPQPGDLASRWPALEAKHILACHLAAGAAAGRSAPGEPASGDVTASAWWSARLVDPEGEDGLWICHLFDDEILSTHPCLGVALALAAPGPAPIRALTEAVISRGSGSVTLEQSSAQQALESLLRLGVLVPWGSGRRASSERGRS